MALLNQSGGILINRGDEFTQSKSVWLDIAADGASEMYITNDPTCSSGGDWENLKPLVPWDLEKENSSTSVYVKFKTNAGNCSIYFNYGTTYGLGKTTNSQYVNQYTGVNYFSAGLYNLAPRTTYYYQSVANCGGSISYGNIMSFTTPGTAVKYTYVSKPVTKVIQKEVVCNCNTNTDTTAGAATAAQYMDLVVERLESGATIGGTATYRAIYKNVSSSTLEDVVVRVILPEELTVRSSDVGEFTVGGRSVVLSLPMLRALEEGRINIVTDVATGLTPGKQLVVNAYANYSVANLLIQTQEVKARMQLLHPGT
jgi:uncharacterized repeat protein (TIGR01451 family)